MVKYVTQIVFLVGAFSKQALANNDERPPIENFMSGSHPLGPPIGPNLGSLDGPGSFSPGVKPPPPKPRGLDGKIIEDDSTEPPKNINFFKSDNAGPPSLRATVSIEYRNQNVQNEFDPSFNDPEIFQCLTDQAQTCRCDSCPMLQSDTTTRVQFREACSVISYDDGIIELPLRVVLDCISEAGILKPHSKEAEALTDLSLTSVVFKSTRNVFKLVGGYAERTIAESEVHFTGQLEKAMAKLGQSDGNYVFSPVSIYSLTAALYMGTSERSESFKELYKVLGYPTVFPKRLARKIKEYTSNIKNFNNFLVHKIPLKKNYGELMQMTNFQREQFDSLVGKENYLNEKVSKATDGMIQDVFEAGQFDEMTSLVLMNTVLFKEQWKYQFSNNTRMDMWNDNSDVKVEYMTFQNKRPLHVLEEDELLYISLPFNNRNQFMTIVMPYEAMDLNTLTFQKARESEIAEMILDPDSTESIILELPKFKFDYKMDVSELMQAAGVTKIFKDSEAELGRMHESDGTYVSKFSHEAAIEINEKGAKAAAHTAVTIGFKSAAREYLIDRPFKFFIHDKQFSQPLFVGQVVCPGDCGAESDGIKK